MLVLGEHLGGIALFSTCAGSFEYKDPGYEAAIVAQDGCVNAATVQKHPIAHIKIFAGIDEEALGQNPKKRSHSAIKYA